MFEFEFGFASLSLHSRGLMSLSLQHASFGTDSS